MNLISEELKEAPKANMHQIVMKKHELIKVLLDNKAKHDVLLETAKAGYWELAKEKIQSKRDSLDSALNVFKEDINVQLDRLQNKLGKNEILPHSISFNHFTWDSSIGLTYPEDHSKDYERAIKMMECSVYQEVVLSEQEFDCYVLNNWQWKQKFLGDNATFVNTMRSRYGIDGVKGGDGVEGLALSGYQAAITGTFQKGISNF